MTSQQTLRLYNTLTRTKQDFVPIDANNVRMYVCGPTVYDYAHIGNARPVIVFDVLFRLLRHLYGEDHVTYVRNITDVDDKINARAAERGISIRELTGETAKIFHEDVAALGCLPPTVEPRATEHIAEMIAVMQKLIDKGHAYAADGHVLFSVPSMQDYGQLARRSLDEMIAGARVEVASYKKSETDFVLWKPSKEGEPGWDSPWGRGRPGWHLECSAMSWKHLGETFDIHGGGIDLVFPHHENEIAQSRCAFGHDVMANYWLHNGFLQVEGEKMSKSVGNFITIRQLLHQYNGSVVRLNMLKTHYRQPIDWTSLELERTRLELREFADIIHSRALQPAYDNPDFSLLDAKIIEMLSDDLNTPAAIGRLKELAENAKKNRSSGIIFATNAAFLGINNLDRPGAFNSGIAAWIPPGKEDVFVKAAPLLTSFKCLANNHFEVEAIKIREALIENYLVHPTLWAKGDLKVEFQDEQSGLENLEDRVKILIAARLEARRNAAAAQARKDKTEAAKYFVESDRIRDELAGMGIQLKDAKNPETGEMETTWEVKR